MDKGEAARAELIAHQRGILLQEIDGALGQCQKGNDPKYPGQEQPLSYHLARLKTAVQQNDMDTIKQYRRGAGSWFPYNNIVEYYIGDLEGKNF